MQQNNQGWRAAVAVALMGLASAVQASLITLDVGVTPASVQIEEWAGSIRQGSTTQAYAGPSFSFSFDVDDADPFFFPWSLPQYDTVNNRVNRVGHYLSDIRTDFTVTPLLAALHPSIATPEVRQALELEGGLTAVTHSFALDSSQPSGSAFVQFSTGNVLATFSHADATGALEVTRSPSLGQILPVDGQTSASLGPFDDGRSVASLLKLHEGHTTIGAFREMFFYTLRQSEMIDGKWQAVAGDQAILLQKALTLTGDIHVQTVTVVPEPASWALMGLGLMGLALTQAARRQRG